MARSNGERRKYWEGLVHEQSESGLSIREFCRQHGVNDNSFYWWRGALLGKKAKRGKKRAGRPKEQVAPVGPKAGAGAGEVGRSGAFVEVVARSNVSGVRLRLTADGTAELCLDRDFDETTLRRALAVIAG